MPSILPPFLLDRLTWPISDSSDIDGLAIDCIVFSSFVGPVDSGDLLVPVSFVMPVDSGTFRVFVLPVSSGFIPADVETSLPASRRFIFSIKSFRRPL